MPASRRLRAVCRGLSSSPSAGDDPITGTSGLQITAIKAYPTPKGFPGRAMLFVKVECAGGIHGWGESGLSGREAAVKGAIEHYSEFLVGQDAMRIGALWQEMYRSQYFEGGRALTAAISAIDIALYDVVGKSLGVPCYQLLGGAHRHHIPCMVTVQGQPTVEACCDEVAARVSEGWTCIRINHFDSDQEFQREMAEGVDGSPDGIFEPRAAIASQVRALLAVRERVGTAPVLGVDFHHRLSVAECASFCQRLPGGTLDWIEEGIRDESPEAYEELRKLTPVPFAIGEEFASKWQFLPFIEKGLTNYARVDICNVGGFTEAMKVAGHCEAHYIDLLPHNPLGPVSTAACVHLGAAVPNFAWLEDNFSPETMHSQWPHEIFPKHTKRESTMERHATLGYPLPTAPGHGVEINEDYLQGGGAAELTGMVGGLRRKDGSLTNW